MKAWYKNKVLPGLLDSTMSSELVEKLRPDTIREAAGTVLEIGSGTGLNFAHYGAIDKLYALEPSKEMIGIAQGRTKGLAFPVEFLNVGAERIPLADESVDTVVSTWTLCSMEKPDEALREVARVLRPGGKFLFLDHGASPKPLFRLIQNILTPLTKHFTGDCHMNRDIVGMVRSAGFAIEKLEQSHERSKPLIFNSRGTAVVHKPNIDKVAP